MCGEQREEGGLLDVVSAACGREIWDLVEGVGIVWKVEKEFCWGYIRDEVDDLQRLEGGVKVRI